MGANRTASNGHLLSHQPGSDVFTVSTRTQRQTQIHTDNHSPDELPVGSQIVLKHSAAFHVTCQITVSMESFWVQPAAFWRAWMKLAGLDVPRFAPVASGMNATLRNKLRCDYSCLQICRWLSANVKARSRASTSAAVGEYVSLEDARGANA